MRDNILLKPAQLDDNLHALEFEIPAELSAKLEALGRPETIFPYTFFTRQRREETTGVRVRVEPRGYRPRDG